MPSPSYLGIRDLAAAKGRFVLVGLVIGLISFMATMLGGLAAGLVDDGISGLRALPLENLAFQDGAGAVFSRSILTEEQLAEYNSALSDPDPAATGVGVSFFNAQPATGESGFDISMWGVEGDSFIADASEGDSEEIARALDGGLVLSEELSDVAEVGDELTIVGTSVTLPVVGFTFAGTYGHVPIAFTSLDTWRELIYGDSADSRFSAIASQVGGTDFDAADAAAGTETITKQEAYAGSPGFAAESATMNLIRGFLLVISALVVGAFFTVWTIQRTRQIGLLKALGASSGYVIRDSLVQLAIVLVVSVSAGAVLAYLAALAIGDGAPFRLTPGSVLGTALILMLVGMAGSLISLRRISSVDPAISLQSGAT